MAETTPASVLDHSERSGRTEAAKPFYHDLVWNSGVYTGIVS